MNELDQAKRFFMTGLAGEERQDWPAAEEAYREALRLAPDRPSVMNNLAGVLIRQERFEEALGLCTRVLDADPNQVPTRANLGYCQMALGRLADALASFDGVLAAQPDDVDALNNRGAVLVKRRRYADALSSLEKAAAIRPDDPDMLCYRASALAGLERYDEAEICLDRALAFNPDHALALTTRATIRRRNRNYEAALADLTRSRALKPNQLQIDGDLINCRALLCEWSDGGPNLAALEPDLLAGSKVISPWPLFKETEDADFVLQCTRRYAALKVPADDRRFWTGRCYVHDKIRVAYISPDFGNHPTSQLLVEVLERHDKSRFETIGVCVATRPVSPMRSRVSASFDIFKEAESLSADKIANFLVDHEIDIAVDLAGFTRNHRMDVFSRRAAPVQVNYFGYPGSTGTDYHDYIIADRHLVPPGSEDYYAECIVRLPDTYMPTDATVRIPEAAPARAELGLPDEGFVFCSLSKLLKIKPAMFTVWMNILKQVDGSVLWLLSDNETACVNLRREAEARGVSGDRLIFADRRPYEEYLAQFRRADLFLDTWPNNAHTVTVDALRAGLPVVTCSGRSFASRVAGSLLSAHGLPELVTDNFADYEALALALARDAARLASLRAKVTANIETHALFDTARYTRHLETAFEMMADRTRRGLPPADLDVPPLELQMQQTRPSSLVGEGEARGAAVGG